MVARASRVIGAAFFVMTSLKVGLAQTVDPVNSPTHDIPPDGKKSTTREPKPAWPARWVGEYANTGMSTTQEQLEVTPTTAVYRTQGCFHRFVQRSRIVGANATGLCLVDDEPQAEDGQSFFRFLGDELVFFEWDGSEFCAPRRQLIEWIHAINFRIGLAVERDMGPECLKKATGDAGYKPWLPEKPPSLPAELQRLILAKPLSIVIVNLQLLAESKRAGGSCGLNGAQWEMKFNVNSGASPLPGSGFTLPIATDSAGRTEIGLVEVVSINGTEVTARLRAHGNPEPLGIAVGVQFDMPTTDPFKTR